MNSREYYASVQKAILAAPHVIQSDISFDEISEEECYIQGLLILTGGYELHIAEYDVVAPNFQRLKYRYHLQSLNNKMIARWDNAPHHPEIKTHPDHLHLGEKIKENHPMDIAQVLADVLSFIE
ncbi:MAG: DUF6516 family protein [Chloroflexi bacterium]|nr:DUF6516 family protein [Chloroflexota bacterium]